MFLFYLFHGSVRYESSLLGFAPHLTWEISHINFEFWREASNCIGKKSIAELREKARLTLRNVLRYVPCSQRSPKSLLWCNWQPLLAMIDAPISSAACHSPPNSGSLWMWGCLLTSAPRSQQPWMLDAMWTTLLCRRQDSRPQMYWGVNIKPIYWAGKVFVLVVEIYARQALGRGDTCHTKLTGWLQSWCTFVK